LEAIYALNELQDVAAEPRIAQLAQSHWLPELKQICRRRIGWHEVAGKALHAPSE